MWEDTAEVYCTSHASIALVWMELYTSDHATLYGVAPIAPMDSLYGAAPGVRVTRPFRSAGVCTSLFCMKERAPS